MARTLMPMTNRIDEQFIKPLFFLFIYYYYYFLFVNAYISIFSFYYTSS